MNSTSRFYVETILAKRHVEQLRGEADHARLLAQLGPASPWRTRLAATLHRLAEHLEPAHSVGEPSVAERPS
jgi:hypothetical protein